jgi:hypothetical protein
MGLGATEAVRKLVASELGDAQPIDAAAFYRPGGVPVVVVAGAGTLTAVRPDGGKGRPAIAWTRDIGSGISGLATGDFDGNGSDDLAVADRDTRSITLVYGRPRATRSASPLGSTSFPLSAAPGALAAADLDGDGEVDLLIADEAGAGLGVLLGNGDGTFRAEERVASEAIVDVAAADVDGDGKPDAIVALRSNRVGVLRGNGDGTFGYVRTCDP